MPSHNNSRKNMLTKDPGNESTFIIEYPSEPRMLQVLGKFFFFFSCTRGDIAGTQAINALPEI